MDVGRSSIKPDLTQHAPAFRRALLRWYQEHGRDLPWRRTRDPYAVLVSELMLQQTQVATVLPYYSAWLRRFPDLAALASASETDVLHAWQGLGYYARARNLHATAKALAATGGNFPRSVNELRQLPGVGRYTAHAVATFAFDEAVPVVEANTARVIARLRNLQLPVDSAAGAEAIWNVAARLVPKHHSHAYNSALMDLGASVCTAGQPRCPECPVRIFCRAENPVDLPRKRARPPLRTQTEDHGLISSGLDVLLEQSRDRWRGMWILPRVSDVRPRECPLYTAQFPFTHHRITLAVYRRKRARGQSDATHTWFPCAALESIPIPSPHRRAIAHLIDGKAQNLCSP